MFKHQPGQISIMNIGHEINLTAILDLYLTLTLSVTSINVRSDRLNTQKPFHEETVRTRHGITVLAGRSNLNTLLDQQI